MSDNRHNALVAALTTLKKQVAINTARNRSLFVPRHVISKIVGSAPVSVITDYVIEHGKPFSERQRKKLERTANHKSQITTKRVHKGEHVDRNTRISRNELTGDQLISSESSDRIQDAITGEEPQRTKTRGIYVVITALIIVLLGAVLYFWFSLEDRFLE